MDTLLFEYEAKCKGGKSREIGAEYKINYHGEIDMNNGVGTARCDDLKERVLAVE